MTYAINFGQSESESSSDESNSVRVRSRRQFNKAEMDSCRDDCVASYLTMHQDVKFSVKEMIVSLLLLIFYLKKTFISHNRKNVRITAKQQVQPQVF